jgi:hypothetical protein
LVYSNLVAVLALSLLLGNHDERRKDGIEAFTVNEGFEEEFGTMSSIHICKTMRTCKAVHSPTKNHVLKLLSFESERKMCKDPWLEPADGKVGGAIRSLRPLATPG